MKKKILIVDDNTDLNRVLQMSLNETFETLSAINGEEAVDLAVTELPDLIIMDLMMNGMNGFEAIRLIRQVPKTIFPLRGSHVDGYIAKIKKNPAIETH